MAKGNKRRKVGKTETAVTKEKEAVEQEIEDVKVEKQTNDDSVDEQVDEEPTNDDIAEPEEEVNDEDDNDDDDDNEEKQSAIDASPSKEIAEFVSDGKYRNKQRCLVACSRGVTARYRHLLEDLRTLMPHHKKESKLDAGGDGLGQTVNDITTLRSCNSFLFLECRKRQDCYMWLGKTGGETPGPSVKFLVSNIHTMDELRLTGNCLKGSRPLLSFDDSFNSVDHLRLLKTLLVDTFGVPRGHPKAKPFIDRVMSFYYADERIWVRNYQILEQQAVSAKEAHETKKEEGKAQATSLVEIGPRFVLNPIRIFRGSFGGPTLYQNPHFVSPNKVRAMAKRKKGTEYMVRKRQREQSKERKEQIFVPVDPLDSVFK